MRRLDSKGFTLVELMVVLAIVSILASFLLVIPLCKINVFVGNEGALACVQHVDSTCTKINLIERHIFAHTRVYATCDSALAAHPNATRPGEKEFDVDSDLLLNHVCTEAASSP